MPQEIEFKMNASPIHAWLFKECLDADISEIYFTRVSENFYKYMNQHFTKEEAFRSSVIEVICNFN